MRCAVPRAALLAVAALALLLPAQSVALQKSFRSSIDSLLQLDPLPHKAAAASRLLLSWAVELPRAEGAAASGSDGRDEGHRQHALGVLEEMVSRRGRGGLRAALRRGGGAGGAAPTLRAHSLAHAGGGEAEDAWRGVLQLTVPLRAGADAPRALGAAAPAASVARRGAAADACDR